MIRTLLALCALAPALPALAQSAGPITIRTEQYPRPPYSGATYYVYERDGAVICTKLAVCNKYDQCQTTYRRGAFREAPDVETGAPYGTTPAVPIPAAKRGAHVCLTKFGLR